MTDETMDRVIFWGAAVCLLLQAATGEVSAGDWPQILGPERNGIASDERLADDWPENGPAEVWRRPVGRGFAGAAVEGERALIFHREGDVERLDALDPATGEVLWEEGSPTRFQPQYGRDDGPLAVPTISDGRVITLGPSGSLICRKLDSGEPAWSHNIRDEFDAREGFFGMACSPLVDDGKVFVNVGGREAGAGMVAFDLESGEVVWKSVADGASYSSPILADVDGVRHLIALTRMKCVSLDPQNGDVRFEFPFGLRGPTVTAANPIVFDGHLFVSASYGIGAVYAEVGSDSVESVWSSNDIMSSQYTTCIEHEGLLYGVDGRQDIPPADLKCFDPRTQQVLWTEPGFGYATLIKADGKLLITKTDGELVLAKLSSEAFQPLARAKVLSGTVRALSALAGGRLFVRNEDTLLCLSVGDPADE